jgi:5-(hydroxymethyl)furfural/furfural oxidase
MSSAEIGAAAEAFDYVVIGGGSAGCAVASRLSEAQGTRVLLVEAGIDTPPGQVPG